MGKEDSLINLKAKESPGILTATFPSFVISSGKFFFAGKSRVKGPGQNFSIRSCASLGIDSTTKLRFF